MVLYLDPSVLRALLTVNKTESDNNNNKKHFDLYQMCIHVSMEFLYSLAIKSFRTDRLTDGQVEAISSCFMYVPVQSNKTDELSQ